MKFLQYNDPMKFLQYMSAQQREYDRMMLVIIIAALEADAAAESEA